MSKITKSIWATPKRFAVMKLVIIYLRLAKSEFGQAYLDYLQCTPVWIPTFFQPQLSQKSVRPVSNTQDLESVSTVKWNS